MVANSCISWYAYWDSYWDSYETLWLSWDFLAQDFATVQSSPGKWTIYSWFTYHNGDFR